MSEYGAFLETVSRLGDLEPPDAGDREAVLAYIEAVEAVALGDAIALSPEQTTRFMHEPTVSILRDRYEAACTGAEDFDPNNDDPSLDSFLLREVAGLGVSHLSRIAFVGCGSVPQSVLAYSPFVGHVTGIDYRPEAVAAAQKAVEDSPNIAITSGRGETYDYSKFSHIVIALMVRDKTQVLERVASTAREGARVAVRTVDGLRVLLHEPLDRVPKIYKTNATIHDPTGKSVYYIDLLDLQPSEADISR